MPEMPVVSDISGILCIGSYKHISLNPLVILL